MKSSLIMVLSGENTVQRHRSKTTLELYHQQHGKTPILISGSHSGFLGRELPPKMKRECHQTADYLISQGIPSAHIRCEESSLCTLGNFYFSQPMILPDQYQIALVTDPFHMNRSLWCSRTVFGDSKEVTPVPTQNPFSGLYKSFIEKVQVRLLTRDLRRFGVKDGDYDSLTEFMRQTHPFYCASTPNWSMYGTFVNVLKKNMKFTRFILPTQRQAYGSTSLEG